MNSFHPVRTGKVSELIVQQLRDSILNGTMKTGDKVPPERELTEQFRASRISVREAFKKLESSGLVTIKPGSGVFVAEVSSKAMSESLSSLLHVQKTALDEVTQARIMFEPSVAKLAAEKITSEGIERLEQNVQTALKRMKSDVPATVEISFEFHSLIADITKNSVLILIVNTINDVCKEWMTKLSRSLKDEIEVRGHSIDYHKRILEAFREKNSEKVYALMMRHLLQVHNDWKRITKQNNLHTAVGRWPSV